MDLFPPIALAGLIVTGAATAMKGERGVLIGAGVGIVGAVLVWLGAVAFSLATEGYSASRFTIFAGLVIGVSYASLAWLVGSVPGGLLGFALHVVARRASAKREPHPRQPAAGDRA